MDGKRNTASDKIRRRVFCFFVLFIAVAMVFLNVHASEVASVEDVLATVQTLPRPETIHFNQDDLLTTVTMRPTIPTLPTVTHPPLTTVNTGIMYALLGDVNGDGDVLADDARLTLRISARLETFYLWVLVLADVNGDGAVLSDDARQILRYSAKLQNGFERIVPVQIPIAISTVPNPTTVPATKPPETTTVKVLSAVQTAWKNIASANEYVSQEEIINALGGASNAYQSGAARGCTNKLTPGSAYIYGDSASTNVLVITSLNPEEIVYEVSLKDNTYATPEGLSVGDSIIAAKQLYGNPDWESEKGDVIRYNSDKPYSLVINYNNSGIITGISLHAKDD